MAERLIEVPPARIAAWVAGFAARHGELEWAHDGDLVRLRAPDGAVAVVQAFLPDQQVAPRDAASIVAWLGGQAPVALILARRGGYSVGVAVGESVVAHKAGTRYVQSRTAAGGQSQQRFARRRANQAGQLVAAVADHAVRVFAGAPAPSGLVLGGDRVLAETVLADRRLAALTALPRRDMFDLPDPRHAVLQQAARRARAARVRVTEPLGVAP